MPPYDDKRLVNEAREVLRWENVTVHNPHIMKRRAIKPIPLAQLEKLSTQRLLARLKQLHQCQDSLSLSDYVSKQEAAGEVFKDSPEWLAAYEQVKGLLAKREHVK